MTVQAKFAQHLVALRAQHNELSSYLTNPRWLVRGVPSDNVFPQLVIDQVWTIAQDGKEGLTEATSIFLSLWYVEGDNQAMDEADAASEFIAKHLHLKRTDNGLFLRAVSRQQMPDAKAGAARFRMQFVATPTK